MAYFSYFTRAVALTLITLPSISLISRNREPGKHPKNYVHHESQYYSHSNNNKKLVSLSYRNNVELEAGKGVFDYISKQLSTSSLTDKKELLIEQLSGENDAPKSLAWPKQDSLTLYKLVLIIDGTSIKVTFCLEENAQTAYSIEYTVPENNFTQASETIEKIDGAEHNKVFDAKIKEIAGQQESIQQSIQESQTQMLDMQKQFNDMRRDMDRSFRHMFKLFDDTTSSINSEPTPTPTRTAGVEPETYALTKRAPGTHEHQHKKNNQLQAWRKKSRKEHQASRAKVCPHCHKHPSEPIEE